MESKFVRWGSPETMRFRLAQVGDAGDVVVVRVCGHALDHVPGQLLGDLRRMVMEPQYIIPDLL